MAVKTRPRYYAGYYDVNGKAVYLTAQQAQQQNVGASNFLSAKAGGIKLADSLLPSGSENNNGLTGSSTGIGGAILNVVKNPFKMPDNGGIGYGTAGANANAPGVNQPTLDSVADDAGGVVKSVADSIGSTLDFLKFIAWIFHPRNILRAVEFLTGITLMLLGARIALSGQINSFAGFSSNNVGISQTGLSRVASAVSRSVREDKIAA